MDPQPRRVHCHGPASLARRTGGGEPDLGANGDVSSLPLPGGITCNFTGVSLFYPDGRGTQRVGIVADVPVVRTILGTREGRDETLAAALAWIAANVP